MPIDKPHILGEIRRIAKANGGRAPGSHALKSQLGIKKSDWYPHIWLRWSDALMEAGYSPNQFQSRTSDELLMQAYTGLIRELGRVPIEGEICRKAKDDKSFPSHTSFGRFGGTEKLIDAAAQFCAKRTDLNDVLAILEKVERPSKKSSELDLGIDSNIATGFVISNEIRATLQSRANQLYGSAY